MENRMLKAALYYHRLGWSVIPCEPSGKKPLIQWEQFQKTPASLEQVKTWWTSHPNANVGVLTGGISGILVLDYDGEQGDASLTELPEIEPTAFCKTGKGGHYYFRHPQDGHQYRNFAGKRPGIDFRGDGGYVIVPPSIHPSGAEYTWRLWPHRQFLALAPTWLLDMVEAAGDNGKAVEGRTPSPDRIPAGRRNSHLTSLAGSMRRRGMSSEAVLAALTQENRRCDPPMEEKELQAIAKSVGRYKPEDPPTPNPQDLPQPVLMSDVNPRTIEWLWYPYIPIGFLTALEGDPGEGKSFVGYAIATALSLPGSRIGSDSTDSVPSLILTSEDDLEATVATRIDEMGGDRKWIAAIEKPFSLDDAGLIHLETLMASGGYGLVIVDPIVSYLPSKMDMHRANEVRGVMSRLSYMAKVNHAAILIIRHLSKGATGKAIYRGQGSIDFAAACRSVMLVGHSPDDRSDKGIAHIKSNLGPLGKPVGYRIDDGVFAWHSDSHLTSDQILAPEEDMSQLEDAKEFLDVVLANGKVSYSEIKKEAEESGRSMVTVKRAKKIMGVVSTRDKYQGEWFWALDRYINKLDPLRGS